MLVGYLASKMDGRYFVAGGFLLFGLMSLWNGSMTLDISQWSLFWPVALSGFAMPMIFIPLSALAMGTIKQEQINSASGIFNFVRNIGSIGISAANAISQRHLQSHRNEMVHWYSGASLELHESLQILQKLMSLHAGPVKAMLRSYATLEAALNSQAQLWAYVDVFRYLAIVCWIGVPLAFVLKKAKSKSGGSLVRRPVVLLGGK